MAASGLCAAGDCRDASIAPFKLVRCGGRPDDGDGQRPSRWPLVLALMLALILLISVSSITYGYFSLGWLHPSSGRTSITPCPHFSAANEHPPADAPSPSPSAALAPGPTEAVPSPVPTAGL